MTVGKIQPIYYITQYIQSQYLLRAYVGFSANCNIKTCVYAAARLTNCLRNDKIIRYKYIEVLP